MPQVLKWPSDLPELNGIRERFFNYAGFPDVCGCVDGTLIPIKAPSPQEIEPQFVDRKGRHSINCMVVCDPDLLFCSANWPGSANDQRVLRNSSLQTRFEAGWRPFPHATLLGDSGYAVKEWLQIPIKDGSQIMSSILGFIQTTSPLGLCPRPRWGLAPPDTLMNWVRGGVPAGVWATFLRRNRPGVCGGAPTPCVPYSIKPTTGLVRREEPTFSESGLAGGL
ncbi:MAG: transposase family protein [Gammaproteobacteria bacterium]|nr:transposase family protein [Gammaproteobacteria bacterium]